VPVSSSGGPRLPSPAEVPPFRTWASWESNGTGRGRKVLAQANINGFAHGWHKIEADELCSSAHPSLSACSTSCLLLEAQTEFSTSDLVASFTWTDQLVQLAVGPTSQRNVLLFLLGQLSIMRIVFLMSFAYNVIECGNSLWSSSYMEMYVHSQVFKRSEKRTSFDKFWEFENMNFHYKKICTFVIYV
jgi:hypothetical protein